MRFPVTKILRVSLACFAGATSLHAESFVVDRSAPTIDKWVYPFAASGGGARTTAPVFGAVGNVGSFDDRDGQFLVGFSLSGQVPAGLGAGAYEIQRATLTLSLSFATANKIVYDATYDPRSTYDLTTGAPINGDDPGRPIELYGAGYRGTYTAQNITETTPYTTSPSPSTGEGVRNIYATDGGTLTATRDVSNNIRDAFDPVPFAIGQVAPRNLNANGTIKLDEDDRMDVVFTLDLQNPNVVSYLRESLNAGVLNLLATSLHQASQGGDATRPEFDAKEIGAAGFPARLHLELSAVPEPSSIGLLLGTATIFMSRRRRQAVTL
ncbi:MAG TPA: PEP-CTERM sorting domain-containing protein [Chthoniobacteraceae bacterium]|jgi:hypothetical protein